MITTDKKKSTQERSLYWDNIKGLLIALVVFAHCLYGLQENGRINDLIVDAIYYFHMPAFVFVSGYFSKKTQEVSFHLCKLIVAYIFFNVFFVLLHMTRGERPHYLSAYTSEWYLMALVVWRLITPFVSMFKCNLLWFTVFSVLAGFLPDIGGNMTFSISKIVTFYPYFLAGYYLTSECVAKIRSKSVSVKVALGMTAMILVGWTGDGFTQISAHYRS